MAKKKDKKITPKPVKVVKRIPGKRLHGFVFTLQDKDAIINRILNSVSTRSTLQEDVNMLASLQQMPVTTYIKV